MLSKSLHYRKLFYIYGEATQGARILNVPVNVPSFLPSWHLFFFSQSSVRRKHDTAIRESILIRILFVYSKRSQRYTWTKRRLVFFVKNFIDFKQNFQWSCTESDSFCSVIVKHPRLLSSSRCYSGIGLACFLYILEQFCWFDSKNRSLHEIEGKRKYIPEHFETFCIFFVLFFSKKINKQTNRQTKKTYVNVVVRILKLD